MKIVSLGFPANEYDAEDVKNYVDNRIAKFGLDDVHDSYSDEGFHVVEFEVDDDFTFGNHLS